MIEETAGRLSAAANTEAAQTLAVALNRFEQAHASFAAVAEDARDPVTTEILGALAAARARTEEAIGYTLGGMVAVREYAHRAGIDIETPDSSVLQPPAPLASNESSDIVWPSSTDVVEEEAPAAPIPPEVMQRARAIQIAIERGVEPERLRGHIKSGIERHVFRLPGGNVLKIPYIGMNHDTIGEALEGQRQYVAAMKRAEDEGGFEQFVGWADEVNGLAICQEIEGKDLEDLSPEELRAIPQEHYDKLIHTLQRAAELRIGVDNAPVNLMYDPRRGFVLIDYEDNQDPEKYPFADRADLIAWSIGSSVCLFSQEVIDYADTTTLAIVSKRFYCAVADTLGLETAGYLLRKWYEEKLHIPTEYW